MLYLSVFAQFRTQGYSKAAEPNRCAFLLELP